MNILRIFVFLFLAFDVTAVLAAKHAFVLGNADYHRLPKLENTHADANAYRVAFRKLGYTVDYQTDLSRDDMGDAFEAFLRRVAPGDQVTFVYSGHGWSDGVINYLIPTDTPAIVSDSKLKRISIALRNGHNGILDQLKNKGVSLTVAIIDACRNNPFKSSEGTRSTSMSKGLAREQAARGTFVIFSAGVGQEALDGLPGDGDSEILSVFTRSFIPHLLSGVYLEDAISDAQVETARLASSFNGHLQHPAYYDEALGKTCLSKSCGLPTVLVSAPAASNQPQVISVPAVELQPNWNLAVYNDVDFYGDDIDPNGLQVANEAECQSVCEGEPTCRMYTYNQRAKLCFRKLGLGLAVVSHGARSGFYFKSGSLPAGATAPDVEVKWKVMPGKEFRGIFIGGSASVESLRECTELCERIGCKGVSMKGSKKPFLCKMRRLFADGLFGMVAKPNVISAYPEGRVVHSSQVVQINR